MEAAAANREPEELFPTDSTWVTISAKRWPRRNIKLINSRPNKCPLCQKHCEKRWNHPTLWVTCRICGEFGLTESAQMTLPDGVLFPLSAFTREQNLRRKASGGRISAVLLTDPTLGGSVPGAVAVQDARAQFPKTVSDQLDRFLLNLSRIEPTPGKAIRLDREDGVIAYADNEDTFQFFVRQLDGMGWLQNAPAGNGTISVDGGFAMLTIGGWNRIVELQQSQVGQNSNQGFVAMWFDASVTNAYEHGLKPAILAAGYDAMRIDNAEHNNKIDDQIIAEIRKSRFLVADFTGHRGGVYFEAGFAMGLGLPVIWTCRQDDIGKAHFDTRQYNHIVWETEADLAERLKHRIEATIGPGRHPPPKSEN